MINSIIEAISIALNATFGDDYVIHMEEIKQGLKEPCFFIQCINPTHDLFLGMYQGNRRYKRENPFCIQYFPVSKIAYQQECNGIAEQMLQCLEYITCRGDDKPIRGTRMKYEVVDGVLNFFINYDLFVVVRHEEDVMEEYTLNSSARKLD